VDRWEKGYTTVVDEVRIVLEDQETASRQYREGLQQGIVTVALDPAPEQGREYLVVVEVPFAAEEFHLKGLVVHADGDTTAIWISSVPGDLTRLCIGAEATTPFGISFDGPSRDSAEPPSSGAAESETGESQADVSLGSESEPGAEPEPESEDEPEPAAKPDGSPAPEAQPKSSDVPPARPSSLDGEAPGDRESGERKRPRSYLSARLKEQAEVRDSGRHRAAKSRKSPDGAASAPAPPRPEAKVKTEPAPHKRTRWDRAPRDARRREARRTRKAIQPFVKGSGIPIPARPDLRVPGIVVFDERLSATSPYEALLHFAAERLTGIALFDLSDGRYWGYFIHGSPVQYVREPEFVAESIENLLVRKKMVSEPVLEQAQRLAALTARPLVSVVMRLRLISSGQRDILRQTQTRLVTEHLLQRESGRARFYDIAEIKEMFLESGGTVVKTLWRSATAHFDALSAAEVEARQKSLMSQYVSLSDPGKKVLHELQVTASQQEFINKLLRPSRQVSRLFKRLPLPQAEAARLLLSLQRMGIIAIAGRGVENEDAAELERRMRERFKRMEKDHFGFLGLHWSALPDELVEACTKLQDEISEFGTIGDTITNYDSIRSAFHERLEEIRKLVENDEARRRYRHAQVGKSEATMAAETLLNQGEMALFRNERGQAKECFLRMLEIDPGGVGSHDRKERAELALMQLDDSRDG